jgi:hypothetical protein
MLYLHNEFKKPTGGGPQPPEPPRDETAIMGAVDRLNADNPAFHGIPKGTSFGSFAS